MNDQTIGYLVLIAVLAVGIAGAGFVVWPESINLEARATGVFLLEDPPVQTLEQTEPSCVAGMSDNCPHAYNPDQTDSDGDGLGDACDDEFNPQPEELVCEEAESGEQAQEIQPPQPLTGRSTKELKRSSKMPVAIAIAALLIAILAGVAYIYRDGIKRFAKRF